MTRIRGLLLLATLVVGLLVVALSAGAPYMSG
jgi:hypothetical protein